jgi:hypothetical protein
MDVATKLQLSRVLRTEARLVLAAMSQAEQAALMAQRPGLPKRPVAEDEANRLVELGLAVRTTDGVDLTMLGRIAARVAYESRTDASIMSEALGNTPKISALE